MYPKHHDRNRKRREQHADRDRKEKLRQVCSLSEETVFIAAHLLSDRGRLAGRLSYLDGKGHLLAWISLILLGQTYRFERGSESAARICVQAIAHSLLRGIVNGELRRILARAAGTFVVAAVNACKDSRVPEFT